MTKFTIALLLTIIVAPVVAFADLIVPGQKAVDWCYNITNIEEYSQDYVFLVYSPAPSYYFVVKPHQCFKFYKLGTAYLFAVKKEDFNKSKLDAMNATELEQYFTTDPSVIKSNITLYPYGTVSEDNPLEKVVKELTIRSINGNKMDVILSRTLYFYNNGSVEEKKDTPHEESYFQTSTTWPLWYIVIPIIAGIAIGFIIARTSKK